MAKINPEAPTTRQIVWTGSATLTAEQAVAMLALEMDHLITAIKPVTDQRVYVALGQQVYKLSIENDSLYLGGTLWIAERIGHKTAVWHLL